MHISDMHIKIFSPVSLLFIIFYLFMVSLQKLLEAVTVPHRGINTIDKDTLFQGVDEEGYER